MTVDALQMIETNSVTNGQIEFICVFIMRPVHTSKPESRIDKNRC